MPSMTGSPLLDLPPELRIPIYKYLFDPDTNLSTINDYERAYDFSITRSVFTINRQIHYEARKVFRDLNKFVRIQTPFPQTLENIIQRQQVPVALRSSAAQRFTGCCLSVKVTAPLVSSDYDYRCEFVIHARDLETFCAQWQWAQLSYDMNQHLALDLELHAPYTPEYETPQVSKKLQEALLLPFGTVKDLRSTSTSGPVHRYASVEQKMQQAQKVPYRRVETTLDECVRFRTQGMEQTKAGDYEAALQSFFKAFRAIHILVVHEDDRQVLADPYYHHVTMTEEPWKGCDGQEERVKLRVMLVANVCEALAGMQAWQRCKFWGMRSISIIRHGYGLIEHLHQPEQEAIPNIFEPISWAKIYWFTARARARLGEAAPAVWLYSVAKAYAPSLAKKIDEELLSETSKERSA